MKVYVYYNLHQHVWSIVAMEGEHRGRVLGHADSVALEDCKMKVREKGRQRVLLEGKKNQHAGIVGNLLAVQGYRERIGGYRFPELVGEPMLDGAWVRITYNPSKAPLFYLKDRPQLAIEKAQLVSLGKQGAFATGCTCRPFHEAAQLDMFPAA